MGIIRTDEWIRDHYSNPLEICKKLTTYFPMESSEREIYQYLRVHGMYKPHKEGEEAPLKLLPENIWRVVKKEEDRLKREWNGPSIPIFIFPVDEYNRKIRKEFNGKSGLAFKDKLFLFFSSNNSVDEIKAVFTHEYNHVCRLTKINKSEDNYTLLDSIIIEGLAENAVSEQCGPDQVAGWTKYYTENQVDRLWKNIIEPNQSIFKSERKHDELLYGMGFYPKMVGYCAGYYLVKRYMEKHRLECKDLFKIPSENIIK
ncbi:DUF2268 domain-containing protein [Ferdinandcohnia quinoae]|uniref:DUF2268 domain-containing protein n=1 Tax=Fredinandcohnia quinoae TaxID=2918902 RepID=A0AAW5EAU4_9BACI|nr:DUF2268 domain-containing protein [Fredinandcohnia sp. SECRCQ15]MCH1625884.1 DUF2268 domain-containing protein [Fredinandcohnia sp. SECRCQ15]